MTERQWTTIDKSAWPRGPWDDEPDKLQWATEAGTPGLIVRGPHGALCGYAAVFPGHPWHGVSYTEHEGAADVHGGLTFSDVCAEGGDESAGICHVPGSDESGPAWWFGFDCAHAGDWTPKHDIVCRGDVYRDLTYVRVEVERLAAYLNEVIR